MTFCPTVFISTSISNVMEVEPGSVEWLSSTLPKMKLFDLSQAEAKEHAAAMQKALQSKQPKARKATIEPLFEIDGVA
jgi:hypothetical protein